MILRRAFELQFISREQFYKSLAVERRRILQSREGKPGSSFEANFAARNGQLLVESIFGSVMEGQTLYREAADILEAKAGTLARLVSEAALAKGA